MPQGWSAKLGAAGRWPLMLCSVWQGTACGSAACPARALLQLCACSERMAPTLVPDGQGPSSHPEQKLVPQPVAAPRGAVRPLKPSMYFEAAQCPVPWVGAALQAVPQPQRPCAAAWLLALHGCWTARPHPAHSNATWGEGRGDWLTDMPGVSAAPPPSASAITCPCSETCQQPTTLVG